MPRRGSKQDPDKLDRLVAEAQRARQLREQGYRERALKLFPWICGRCAREFTRENLRELTVHHRDHDHDNNPPDGSNWELLCIYCHDNEHSRHQVAEWYDETSSSVGQQRRHGNKPFAGLKDLLKRKKS